MRLTIVTVKSVVQKQNRRNSFSKILLKNNNVNKNQFNELHSINMEITADEDQDQLITKE